MPSDDLSGRIEKVVGYPPLCEMSDLQRREFPRGATRGRHLRGSSWGHFVYNEAMTTESIILPPGGGRAYDLGPMRGVFKADGPETQDRYCASEWSLEPRQPGPGPHHHKANEEVFIVTEGTMWFLIGEDWLEAPTGTFLRIPAGVTHDFENRGDERASAFNVFIPGGFEAPFREWVEADRAASG